MNQAAFGLGEETTAATDSVGDSHVTRIAVTSGH